MLKRAGFRGLVLLAAIPASGAGGTPPQGSDRSKTEQELLALETAWDDAVVAKDTTALQRIIADDFVMIGANGTVSDKRQLIEGSANPQLQIQPFQTEDWGCGSTGTSRSSPAATRSGGAGRDRPTKPRRAARTSP